MRISDWSSDVCSSDLLISTIQITHRYPHLHINLQQFTFADMLKNMLLQDVHNPFDRDFGEHAPVDINGLNTFVPHVGFERLKSARRSEERRVGKACVSTFRSCLSPYH